MARSSTGRVRQAQAKLIESYFTRAQTRESWAVSSVGTAPAWATQRAAFVAFPAASYTHSYYYTVAYELCHDG